MGTRLREYRAESNAWSDWCHPWLCLLY